MTWLDVSGNNEHFRFMKNLLSQIGCSLEYFKKKILVSHLARASTDKKCQQDPPLILSIRAMKVQGASKHILFHTKSNKIH